MKFSMEIDAILCNYYANICHSATKAHDWI